MAKVSTMYERVVYLATGSGIGPCLGQILADRVPGRLVWSTRDPRRTYGDALVDEVAAAQPDAVIWDTTTSGKPDLLQLALDAYADFDAEAVMIVSNKPTTRQARPRPRAPRHPGVRPDLGLLIVAARPAARRTGRRSQRPVVSGSYTAAVEAEALDTLVLVLAIAVLSPFISDFATRWMRLPGVVIEIGLGILLGPYVLGWLEIDDIVDFLAEMGLVFLIFLAGFEIDPDVVKGRPVRLAVTGWVISLVLAVGIATALHSPRRDVRRPVRRRRPDDHGHRHAAADPRGCRHPRHQARDEHPRQRGDR